MQFYTGQHPYCSGIDLHARIMQVCIPDRTRMAVAERTLRGSTGTAPGTIKRLKFMRLMVEYV